MGAFTLKETGACHSKMLSSCEAQKQLEKDKIIKQDLQVYDGMLELKRAYTYAPKQEDCWLQDSVGFHRMQQC